MSRTVRLLTAALVSAALLTACDGDSKPSGRESSSPKPPVVLPTGTPTPVIPSAKPTTLQQTDFIVGTGETALPGRTLTVRYVGMHYDGTVFDTSFAPGGHPITFVLGNERVIAGWDKGLIGMREGGRRQLVIPPDLAYGADGRAPSIRPNETLVFVVDLVSVAAGAPAP